VVSSPSSFHQAAGKEAKKEAKAGRNELEVVQYRMGECVQLIDGICLCKKWLLDYPSSAFSMAFVGLDGYGFAFVSKKRMQTG